MGRHGEADEDQAPRDSRHSLGQVRPVKADIWQAGIEQAAARKVIAGVKRTSTPAGKAGPRAARNSHSKRPTCGRRCDEYSHGLAKAYPDATCASNTSRLTS